MKRLALTIMTIIIISVIENYFPLQMIWHKLLNDKIASINFENLSFPILIILGISSWAALVIPLWASCEIVELFYIDGKINLNAGNQHAAIQQELFINKPTP